MLVHFKVLAYVSSLWKQLYLGIEMQARLDEE
jgi:hypothetical protein